MLRPPCALVVFVLVASCADPQEAKLQEELASSRAALDMHHSGTGLNGTGLNGTGLNGQPLSSIFTYVKLEGAKLSGNVRLDRVELRGTVFHGWTSSARWQGMDFLQSEWIGVLGDGSTRRLRIKHLQPDTEDHPDVWRYHVEYRDVAEATWYPICTDAQGGALEAIPVAGRWDYRRGEQGGGRKIDDPIVVTFGCVDTSAIAKCVMLGYKPWVSETLARHHQACTRLIRADFCGDGRSHTEDGKRVNLYDNIGIQHDTKNWFPEAEWDEDGARCFNPMNRSHSAVPCYDQRVQVGCGSTVNFSMGTLLINETPGDGVTRQE